MKKLLTGIFTLMMTLSLVLLPGGMTAWAAQDIEQQHYFFYFDANNGKLYKTSGFVDEDNWQPDPAKLTEYTGVDISCKGRELTLHDFYLFPENAAVVIKGDAVLKLEGENIVDSGTYLQSRYSIYAYDDLTITGNGSLTSHSSFGAHVKGDFTINTAHLEFSYLYVIGNFIMDSGSLLFSHSGTMSSFTINGNTIINGGNITVELKDAQNWGLHLYKDLIVNGGVLSSTITHDATNLASRAAVYADGEIIVNNGTLIGNVYHSGSATGIQGQQGVTINGGTVSAYISTPVGTTDSFGHAIYSQFGPLVINGGTVEAITRDDSDTNDRSYATLSSGLQIADNIKIIGGHSAVQIYDSLEIKNNRFFIDSESGNHCHYIKFTTPVSGIGSGSDTNSNLVIGGSTTLDATVIPENSSNQKVDWTSSDDTIASVDENGKVTGHKPGTVTITATTEDGGHKKEFTVTVSKQDGPAAPTGITGVAPTTAGGSDGRLTGVNPSLEYSTNKDFTDAKDCTGSEVAGLPAGTYYVRVKETDTAKAGAATAVAIPAGTTSGGGNSGSGTGSGDPATDQAVADSLGVSTDTAKQIIDEASKLGVSTDTLMITDTSIKNQKSDADLKGSSFGMLKARTSNLKKNSVTVRWDKVKDADGYILYGNKCGKKNTFKHIKTFTKNSTVKYTQKKLKKGTYYKYLVVAYKNINGVKVTIAAAKNVHATTKGGKFGVAKSVKVNKTSKTLAVKKKFKIKASEVKLDKKISHHRNIKFESDNSRVATVNNKGVVTAKQKGKCYIYVYAQNGVYKRIKITVK